MNKILSRTSSAAVMMAGKPEQIKAVLAGWMEKYGRDMPLAYVLSLHDESKINAPKAG